MSINYIDKNFQSAPKLPFVNIIKDPTPLYRLTKLEKKLGHHSILIKREDLTHSTYGGNKVRNLEFVLAQALAQNAKEVVTIVPKGSNFTAALSVHAKILGIRAILSQFVAVQNPQIEAHHRFSGAHGAQIKNFQGLIGPLLAAGYAARKMLTSTQGKTYYISPGASSLLGALGHLNAFLEFAEQLSTQNIEPPQYLIVGSGTCGTTAGLLAGIHLTGLNIKLIGVRSASMVVCNKLRVHRIVKSIFAYLGFAGQRVPDFTLTQSPNHQGYAVPSLEALKVSEMFKNLEGIELDSTYTSKVGHFIKDALENGQFRNRTILYWHTFSPLALRPQFFTQNQPKLELNMPAGLEFNL